MSERTAPSLAKIDRLLTALNSLPAGSSKDELVETTDALRRAVAAFHMEAIRFRMHSVDRLLKPTNDPDAQSLFQDVRHELEAAGFHTRSHAAPPTSAPKS